MSAPNIRDFSYAPHRCASEAKTLARLVIYFGAAMSTLSQVAAARGPTSEEGSASVETLEFLTDEVMLQMGMLADAAMETYSLVRDCASSARRRCESDRSGNLPKSPHTAAPWLIIAGSPTPCACHVIVLTLRR